MWIFRLNNFLMTTFVLVTRDLSWNAPNKRKKKSKNDNFVTFSNKLEAQSNEGKAWSPLQAGEYSKYREYENFVKFANKLEADANEAEEDKLILLDRECCNSVKFGEYGKK